MQFQQFFLKYSVSGQQQEVVSSDFSVLDTAQLKLEFLLEELQGSRRYTVLLTPKVPMHLDDFYITAKMDYADTRGVYCNGFQSWTESRIFAGQEKLKRQMPLLRKIGEAYGDGLFYAYKNQPGLVHSWNYTYLRLPKKRIHFLGSLSEQNGYTVFEHNATAKHLKIQKDVQGAQVSECYTLLDIYEAIGTEIICFDGYMEAQQLKPIAAAPAIGWTSWYYYYTNISEKVIEDNIQSFVKEQVPIEIFQIDDGWQKAVGDWLNINEKFPNGLRPIVDKIHSHGVKAGLWLAPLACERNSFIVREKPDWILKDEKGDFLKIGFNPLWSYWFYAIDVYHEEVRAYLKKVFHTILHEWDFDLVKLDFLYGSAILPRNGKSRGQIMHESMQFLRECVGDKMILGCGVPLSAAAGTTEYCRIGPDIHLSWDFTTLRWIRARERPSVLNAIHNAVGRRQLSGKWFWNDPDVFILRKNKNILNFQEKYSLLLANLLFGHLLFTSDNIGEYDAQTLWWYKSIFPLMPVKDAQVSYHDGFYTIHFRIKERIFLCLINTGDSVKRYKLPDNLYYDNVEEKLIKGNKQIELQGHASKCLLLVGHTPFAIAGSKGHFFAGTEIDSIFLSGNKIELEWAEGLIQDVKVYIKVPLDYPVETVNNSEDFKRIDHKDYAIIEVEKKFR